MKTISIEIPGSKSLTNRAILLASLSDGSSNITNPSNSLDSQIMVGAMKKLGIRIKQTKNKLEIMGNNGVFKETNGKIDAGSAGTVARFLTALSVVIPGNLTIDMSDGMKKRPMKELVAALKKIRTGKVSIKGHVSSQFISSLLMVAPLLKNGLEINIIGNLVSKTYVNMTTKMMKQFGVTVMNNDKKFIVKNHKYRSIDLKIEADSSCGAYFLAIAAVTNKKIKINIDPQSVQGDAKFADVLKAMGCSVKKNNLEKWIEVQGSKNLKGITVDMNEMPDAAQTLAVVAAFAKGKTEITGLSTLKVKETDRLTALKNELTKLKIKNSITKDSMTIFGGKPQSAVISTYGDHRMAMAFAIAKARIPELIIKNPEVVEKSFPEFWKLFEKARHRDFSSTSSRHGGTDKSLTQNQVSSLLNDTKKIILIGFMGSGKTSVAKALGEKLNLEVIEMDDLVLKISGRSSISEIFSLDGENRFRALERQISKNLRNRNNMVISTGGGVVIDKANIDNLKKNGKMIFLKTSFPEVKRRLKNLDDRPLFRNKISAEKLFILRQRLYEECADLIIETDNITVDEVVNNLRDHLAF